MIAAIAGLAYSSFWVAGIVGMSLELSIATILLVSLLSNREFDYDSWIGWLFSQYIVMWNVSIIDIINLIFARMFCLALLLFSAITTTFWLILPVSLYLLGTCVHTLPHSTPPMN